jgi:tetratricopeptide (TPR) repeat protein
MTRWLAPAALAALCLTIACAGGGASSTISSDPTSVHVDASTLWDPNVAQDPIVSYRLRLATEPRNPALHNNLGNLYVLRNWMDEAVREYKQAIDLDPVSPIAWNNLGTAYMKMGKQGPALSAFQRAVKNDGRYALGWYNIGVIYDAQGKYDEAIEMYLKAASFKPEILDVKENPQAVNNRHLQAVRLRRYLEQEGNLALPLESMPE